MESPKSVDTKGLHVSCADNHIAVMLKWGTMGHTCVFCLSIKAELKKLALVLKHRSLNLESANPGGVGRGGVDSAHLGDVDLGREDSPFISCLDIKSEIKSFMYSEGAGSREPNALKTNQKLTGFRLEKETLLHIKEENLEKRQCITDRSEGKKLTQMDIAPLTLSSPLVKSVGPGLPCVPGVDSTVPTETHHSHQLGSGVTTCVMLCDRAMESFHNNPESTLSEKIKTVKPDVSHMGGQQEGEKEEQYQKRKCIEMDQLNLHKRVHRREKHTGEKPYRVEEFGKGFAVGRRLAHHNEKPTGEKKYKCNVYGKVFSEKGDLLRQIMTHTGEKPYKCDTCGKGFAVKSTLAKHGRTHTGEKPYKCDVCDKGFAQKEHLLSHKRTHTGEKPYVCAICSTEFARKYSLLMHSRTHTGEKPFICDVCGKGFAQQSTLVKHKMTHTGEKPHKCHLCNKKYARKSDLLSHSWTHTGVKPYSCDICGKEFAWKKCLLVHSRAHTREKP